MRGREKYIVSLLWVLVSSLWGVSGQEPVRIVDSRFEPQEVLLGDHFDLVMEVEAEEGHAVAFPDFTEGMAEGLIELIKEGTIDTVSHREGVVALRKRYTLTSFEPGHYTLDSLGVLHACKPGEIDTLSWPAALEMTVGMIPIDTTQTTIYGVKEPLKAPLYAEEFSGYLSLVLLVGAVIASLIWLLVRMRRGRAVQEVVLPSEPPQVVAIRRLERLHSQKLWQNERLKEYYTILTDILREYLDGRYGVDAPEMTSEEILAALKRVGIGAKHYMDLERLLSESDLVKFAKYSPEREYHEEAYYKVYYFVEESKEVAQSEATKEEPQVEQ